MLHFNTNNLIENPALKIIYRYDFESRIFLLLVIFHAGISDFSTAKDMFVPPQFVNHTVISQCPPASCFILAEVAGYD